MTVKTRNPDDNGGELSTSRVVIGIAADLGADEELYRSRAEEHEALWLGLSEALRLPASSPVGVTLRRLALLPDRINVKNYRQFAKQSDGSSHRATRNDVEALRANASAIEFKMVGSVAYLRIPNAIEALVVGVLRETTPVEVRIFSDLEYELDVVRSDARGAGSKPE